jgi:glucosylglycerate phosphorylase
MDETRYRRYLRNPDYSRPTLDVPPAQRKRIVDILTVLYGELDADAYYWEVERLMQVHHAHRPLEMLTADAEFDSRDRFTERDVVAITYGDLIDSPNTHPLRALSIIFENLFRGVFSTVHILPFFPYSSDRGFSVIDYETVDPRLGRWEDIERLGDKYRLMFDGVINHVSSKSEWFREFLARNPDYEDFFVSFESPQAISEAHLRLILRPRTSSLLTEYQTLRGPRWVWTTFSPDQIDLNFRSANVLFQVLGVLLYYVRRGAGVIRLDAATYLWRELGTSSAHLPQTHALVQLFRAVLDVVAPRVALVTETNVPHDDNVSYFGDGTNEAHMVYNFALPPLVLWTFHAGDWTRLAEWASTIAPPTETTTFLNFLDSHDGIGLLPVADLLSNAERQQLVRRTIQHGGLVSYRAREGHDQAPYELNIPWYNALNDVDSDEPEDLQIARFLASRAIAMTLVGVPAIYLPSIVGAYVTSDYKVNERDPRSINRNTIHVPELLEQLSAPASHAARILERFVHLIHVRTRLDAFHPSSDQRVVFANPAVFSIMRSARRSEGIVIALTNVTARAQELRLSLNDLDVQRSTWRDALTERYIRSEDDVLRVPLDAYETIWLEPSRA